jgi:hypothetical protein
MKRKPEKFGEEVTNMAEDDAAVSTLQAQSLIVAPDVKFDDDSKLPYLLFKPPGWTPAKKWPLLVSRTIHVC